VEEVHEPTIEAKRRPRPRSRKIDSIWSVNHGLNYLNRA